MNNSSTVAFKPTHQNTRQPASEERNHNKQSHSRHQRVPGHQHLAHTKQQGRNRSESKHHGRAGCHPEQDHAVNVWITQEIQAMVVIVSGLINQLTVTVMRRPLG